MAQETFGGRLRVAMVLAGKTTGAVAVECRVSSPTVRSWLKMTEPRLTVARLQRLCVVLGVNMPWLASGEGPRERE